MPQEKKETVSTDIQTQSEQIKTYSLQSTLPRLPLPTLEETLQKFKTTVEAILPPDEKESIDGLIHNFLHKDGPKLQELLVEYDKECAEAGRSYVEEFWNNAYLVPDTSVVLNVNPFFLLEDGPDSKTSKDQIGRAASLAFATCKFSSLLKKEMITPDYFKGRALCMDQFKSLFGSCRVPCRSSSDCVQVYPESTHVVVLCRNQMYYFQALWDDGTLAVDESDISHILKSIVSDAGNNATTQKSNDTPRYITNSDKAIGVLTTLERDSWAVAREDLLKTSSENKAALAIVDSALFVLVLDDYTPENIHDAANNILHGTYALKPHDKELFEYQVGTCMNRWYDKLQIIVCKDGSAGVNFEHSSIDGHTA